RDSVGWFTDYARLMFDRLGDRVALWATHNEPWVISFIGHAWGVMAPGIADYSQAFQTAHHLLVSHGQTVQLFRQGGYQGKIGIVLNLSHNIPLSDSEADLAACQRADAGSNTLYLDPLFKGQYPAALMAWIGPHAPQIQDGDLALINQPLDFLGVNYYMTYGIRYFHSGGLYKLSTEEVSAPNWGQTAMGWGIYPPGLTAILLRLKNDYGNPPVYVTENGCALADVPDENGVVADPGRINFLRAHFLAAHDALQAGANLQGYYVWSLLDNFEWAYGYAMRFGLVRVDYDSGRRTLKQSAHWYRDVIAQNGVAE
nr:family 1 glycosylhydrolase [Anaerolineae bacterium]